VGPVLEEKLTGASTRSSTGSTWTRTRNDARRSTGDLGDAHSVLHSETRWEHHLALSWG
jgi:hypothetical protein